MSNDFPQINSFRNQLQKSGADFICTTRLPAASVSVYFLGLFQGKPVLWNMTLATLSHLQANRNRNNFTTETGEFTHPYIEIKEGSEGALPIQVGLDLEKIDEPVIKKTIIMIRNYKRLAVGRIEFGSMHT